MPRRPPSRHSRRAIAAAASLLAPSKTPTPWEQGMIDAGRLSPFEDRPIPALIEETIRDDAGLISQPYRVQSMLDRMVERGDITDAMRTAGERFNQDYRLAALDALRASDMQREVRYQGSDMGQAIIDARRRRDDALDALGGHSSPAGVCAWFVLGDEMSVRDWAIREGWNGRPLSEHGAKGILLATLGALVGKYGL